MVLAIALGSIWFYRSAILKRVLIETVSDRSNGRLLLSVDEIDYNPFEESIKVVKLKLMVSQSDSVNKKQTQLSQLSFDSVTVVGFDLWKLLKEREIKATEILTAKPEMLFLHAGKQKKNNKSLGHHLQSIHENSGNLSILPIEIDILKVEYGNVVFEDDSTKKFLGSADFMVELHNFNTTVDTLEFDSHSFLYSRRLIIDISDFLKLLKNDRKLSIKNIRFDSKFDKLDVYDFYLSRGTGGVVDSIFIKDVEIAGLSISEIKNGQDLSLRSIIVNSGFVGIRPDGKKDSSKNEKTTETLEQLFPLIKQIDIDTLLFADFDCELLRHDNNKIAFAEGVGFQFVGLLVDSSMYFRNVVPHFDLFEFGLKYLSFDSTQNVEAENITYSSNTSQLKISNLLFGDTVADIDFKTETVLVDGLDIKRLLNKKTNSLVLTLLKPEIIAKLSLEYFNKNKKKKQGGFADLLKLEEVIVKKADISLYNNEGLRSGINKLDVSFKLLDNGDTSRINLSSLTWASKGISFSNEDKSINFSSTHTSYQNNYLNLKNGKFKFEGKETNVEKIDFGFVGLGISDFELLKMIDSKSFITERIVLTKPQVSVLLNINDSLKNAESTDSVFIKMPLNINVGELVLNKGNFDLKIKKNNKTTLFSSGFNLKANKMEFPEFISFNEIQQIGLSLKLYNSLFETESIKSNIEDLTFNTSDSCINIQNLNVDLDSLVLKNMTLSSEKFNIENIQLIKLDYLGAIRDKEIKFDKLLISNPEIDLSSYKTENTTNKIVDDNSVSGNGLSKSSFREFELKNLSLNYNLTSNGSEKNISLADLDLMWTPQEDSINLVSELNLNIGNFEFFNKQNQSKIKIDRIFTSQLNSDLEFSNLSVSKPLMEEENGFYARVPTLSFKNITHTNEQSYEIEIDEVQTDSLFLEFNNKETKQNQLSFSGRVEALEKYSDLVKRFNIRKSSFHNVDLSVNNISDSSHKEFVISELDIFASDAGFSSGDSSMLHLSSIKLDINEKKLITADSLYEITSGNIYYDFASSSISIDSFRLKPRYASKEFFKKAVYQTTMLDLKGDRVVLSGIDFQRAISKKEYFISSVDLDGFKLIAHRDKKYPFKHGTEKPFPSVAVKSVKSDFYVDTLRLNDSYILFGEYVKGSEIPGEVYFTDVNIVGRELSNMPELMTFPPTMKLDLSSKVMGNTLLKANFAFPLNEIGFSFTGKTDEIDFRDFNSMTQNLFGISITKGKGYLDIIGINAGDSIASGSLIFRYKKLRVRLYNREKAQLNKGIEAPFFSFLVNDLLIKSNNPRFLGKTRIGHVYIEPNKEKVFINYIWKGLLSGMLSTMWYNSKEQRKEKKRMNQNAK